MKRSLIFVAAGLLVLAMAVPAASSSEIDVPASSGSWEIDCLGSNHPDLGVRTIASASLPGWPDGLLFDVPVGFHAARVDIWSGSDLFWSFQIPGPSGIKRTDGLVGPCQAHLSGGSRATFDIEMHDVYYVGPGT